MHKNPVILSSVVTTNEAAAVTGRIRGISINGFEYLLQEQEKNPLSHAKETVAYIAWEPGVGVHNGMRYEAKSTTSSITNKTKTITFSQNFAAKPFILGGMQTTNEIDTSLLRITKTSTTGMSIFIEEEKSKDTEVIHQNEKWL